MNLSQPIPFAEAVNWLMRKSILPTDMGTAELRDLDAKFRQQSFFSARNAMEDILQGEFDAIESIINPKQEQRPPREGERPRETQTVTTGFNKTTARVEIKRLLKERGYSAEPGEAGTIKDLSSDQRINLVIDTNERLAHGYGFKRQGNSTTLLRTRPGWELYRQERRKEERDWQNRFRLAGDLSGSSIGDGWTITPDGRLIALKNHPIWEELGSSANFDDALDVSYPPFAFNSGMWVRDVTIEECLELGILQEGQRVQPDDEGFHVMDIIEEAIA